LTFFGSGVRCQVEGSVDVRFVGGYFGWVRARSSRRSVCVRRGAVPDRFVVTLHPSPVPTNHSSLTHSGIYQKNLFRALPHRARLLHLIDAFDSQPHFGVHTPLHTESMPDICALLSTYLSSLPEPVLSSALFEAVWAWCVWPSLEREEKVERFFSTRDEERENEARGTSPVAVEDEDEATQISLARLLLNLLPSANFSLMVYLLAFFSQVLLAPENGIAVEDLGRMFGVPVFGGSVKSARRKNEGTVKDRENGDGRERVTDGREGRAGVMMVWFITRWRRISEGLFEDEGHGGPEQEREVRLKYVDTGGSIGWMPSQDAPGDFFGSSPALSSSNPVSRPSSSTDSDDSFTPPPMPLARPLDLKGKGKARAIEADGEFVSLIQNDRVEIRDPGKFFPLPEFFFSLTFISPPMLPIRSDALRRPFRDGQDQFRT